MRLIGTAGHIDHGKTTLVHALTGIHPSRLPEEHARGMTIDLGYAYLHHPDGYRLGVVDVPGHEKLVRNMVAGATGFELALWVVDAAEGVMPQSLEHLRILELLRVRALIPVITKADLATADQIAATQHAVAPLLARFGAPVQPLHIVDSLSRRGIAALKQAIVATCRDGGPAHDAGSGDDATGPYLAVDRVFSVKGIGTVVTGTLVRGQLAVGDQVAVTSQPGSWRVRSLNNHHAAIAAIGAGHRVGVSLVGLGVEDVRRGDVLVAPDDSYRGRFVNARLQWLADPRPEYRHGARLLFHSGCLEVECRLWGSASEGSESWAQIELPHDAYFHPGQRFILRAASPLATVGGGEVLDLAPDRKRHVTAAERMLYRLRERGAPYLEAYLAGGGAPVRDIAALATRWMVPEAELRRAAESVPRLKLGPAATGPVAPRLVWHADHEARVLAWLRGQLQQQTRSEQRIPYSRVARALTMRVADVQTLLRCLLDRDDATAVRLRESARCDGAALVLFPGHVAFAPDEQRTADQILSRLLSEGLRPARIDEYRSGHAGRPHVLERVFAKLRAARRVVRVSETLMLHADAAAALHDAAARLAINGIRAAEFGQALGVSRKYSIPYLEYLNREGVLRREGELHHTV